ncbi:hypothetical protein F478_03977, partial [Pseudomonas sp. URIL14HWK12:I2]
MPSEPANSSVTQSLWEQLSCPIYLKSSPPP